MGSVAIVAHHLRPQAAALAAQAVAWLDAAGHQAHLPADDAKAVGLADRAASAQELREGTTLAVSLGGDGTMLRAVDMFAPVGVPVLGVNVGHLGYLTEVEPDDLPHALERYFAGDFTIESRMTLAVTVAGREELGLNEVVVEKTVSGHTVRVAVEINGLAFTTYAADGLIVATPTGSTAYNLSARGPIVSPAHRALILTPVSPHMLFDRPMVLGPDETIVLAVASGPPAAVVVDGRDLGVIQPGETVSCAAGPHDARLVTFGQRNFHGILKSKFGLADR